MPLGVLMAGRGGFSPFSAAPVGIGRIRVCLDDWAAIAVANGLLMLHVRHA